MILAGKVLYVVAIIFNVPKSIFGKYVEGHLKTLEDWAFVARFCFLSGKGRYEYHIEFERRYGEPQLLLYYDDDSQWPAIYKTGKTCTQKLAVLSARDNQIVTLSARNPYNVLSGCMLRTTKEDEDEDDYGDSKPKSNPRATTPKPKDDSSSSDVDGTDSSSSQQDDEWNYTYYGQFLKTTSSSPLSSSETGGPSTTTPTSDKQSTSTDFNVISLNDTAEIFNSSSGTFVPVGIDFGGRVFENEAENNTRYREYVEELFSFNGNMSDRSRWKRAVPKRSDSPGILYVSCRSSGGFITARERWWYIAIANCGSKKGIDIKYKFRMTNGAAGDFWHEHFSADEMYIPPILLTESILYTFLMLAIFICAMELKSRHLFHCTYRLFTFSAALQYVGILFSGVAWTKYAITGLGPHTLFGTLLQGASEITFLSLLLLMAKGYTITRARLSTCSTIKLMTFVNVYVIVYIALFIYREEVFDPGEVLNLYESPAGLAISGLRCGAWGAFLVSAATTAKKYPEKANFYYPFGILGSVWILGGPFLVFLGISFFDAWVRESVMSGVFAVLALSGHASFLWLTWPSRANISFPYHVRTNHVGVMSTEDDGEDYPRHVYEPAMEDQNIIVPLSRRTEELLNGVYNQYLSERDHYNSPSTPHSHASFPTGVGGGISPSAPPSYPQQSVEEQSTRSAPLRFGEGNHQPGVRESAPSSPQSENQTDSGHSSFDAQSTTTKTTTPPKDEQQPERSNRFEMKNNPFVINGVKSQPNRIILDPITPPVKSSPGDVPRHLFAARKTSQ